MEESLSKAEEAILIKAILHGVGKETLETPEDTLHLVLALYKIEGITVH